MDIALLGNNEKNRLIENHLSKFGFKTFVCEDISTINHIRARDYGFEIYTDDGNIKKEYIIFTEKPDFSQTKMMQNKTSPMHIDDENIKNIENADLPIVFLLDWEGETDTEAVGKAILNAISVIKKKKKVFFLSKTVRTAIEGYEELYDRARNLGINFLKYTEADVQLNNEDECYDIEVSDMYGSINIKTNVLAIGGSGKTNEDIVKTFNDMRSKTDENKNKYFFQGFKSTVKGIYNLDGVTYEDDLKNLNSIISDISRMIENKDAFIEIDEGKCAFCNTCIRVCPHAALEPDYEISAMKPILGKCDKCGACFSVCPANAISLIDDYDISEYGQRLMIFACENSGAILLDELLSFTKENKIGVKQIDCGCSIRPEDILNSLNDYEKVAVISCMDGACRHIDGTEKTKKTIDRTKNKLENLGISPEKVYHVKVSWAMPNYIKDSIECILKEGAKV